MTESVAKAYELLEAGDIPGALRHLRRHLDEFSLTDQAGIAERLAAASGFDDLAQAATALATDPEHPQHLYDFGYACIERGAAFLALPALRALVEALPHDPDVYRELVAALEREDRHAEVVDVLRVREKALADWPDRYLLAHNALLSGDPALARATAATLADPGEDWREGYDRLRRMLSRADTAAHASPLDDSDLRGWHFVLTGGLLAYRTPDGMDAGMNGRFAWVQESMSACRAVLARLEAVLASTGQRPGSVAFLTDRNSEIVGRAVAEILGLPAAPFAEPRAGELVVAYDLTEADPDMVEAVGERAPEQLLYEHAMCWTNPPVVCADITGLMHQVVTPPWQPQLRASADGGTERGPADERPAAEIATELAATPVEPGEAGEAETGFDPVEALADFAARVGADWLVGRRGWMPSSGPVRSNRFA